MNRPLLGPDEEAHCWICDRKFRRYQQYLSHRYDASTLYVKKGGCFRPDAAQPRPATRPMNLISDHRRALLGKGHFNVNE